MSNKEPSRGLGQKIDEHADPGKFWDQIFSRETDRYGVAPNDFLRLASGLLKPGSRILSLGEGEGRNAIYLMGHGHRVTCVDASPVARDHAVERIAARFPGVPVDFQVIDLSKALPDGKFDAVVSIWCHLPSRIRRRVHAALEQWLLPGGIFVAEGYSPDQPRYGTGGPADLDMLYDPATLKTEIPLRLELIQKVEREVMEGVRHDGLSSTVQIIGRKP